MGERDYCSEMRAVIDAATETMDEYVAGIVAHEIVEKLRESDPDLLHGWLDAQAARFVREAIGTRDRSLRSHLHRTARAREFDEATQQFHDGDLTALTSYMTMPVTVGHNVRKPLGRLNHDELLFAHDDYARRAHENKIYADVMARLAETVMIGVVEDHYTEQQLRNIFTCFN